MTREEIKQADNIVATKPRLLNDNTMHYCPGCSHGVVHKLVAEVIEEMGAEHIEIGIPPDAHRQSPQQQSVSTRHDLFSPTRATATLPQSALQRQSTPQTVAKT